MQGAHFLEGLFKKTLKSIEDECFVERNRTSATSFTRNRKLTFKSLLINLMGFTRPSVQTELDRFYKALSQSSTSFESISKSAFTQARKKLKPEAFIELAKGQLDYFYENAPYQKSWKGRRVVAIDGSLLNLPHTEDIEREFGGVTNQHEKIISARCSFAYDVCNELVLDSRIAPRRSCEKELAVEHLQALNPESDILVFDRGYPCQWLMGLLEKKNFKFCFRLSSAWKEAYKLLEDGENDQDWTLIRRSHREWGKLKTYGLSKTLKGLRLVSIDLPSGEKEILVTNLTNRNDYTVTDLKTLYHLRWGVEESYKSFKKTLHIEHFTGKSPQSIYQDFYARVFMLNMATMIRTQGIDQEIDNTSKKHQRKANKTQVLAKVKDFLTDIFFSSRMRLVIKQMLKILRSRLDIIRSNRSFERSSSSARRRSKIINHKGI